MAAVVSAPPPAARAAPSSKTETFTDTKRRDDVRHANIEAARAVADAVRTSLGPRGMDKMIITPNSNEVIITNDGATILSQMSPLQPAARMLADLSRSQDTAAGDGTTSVVVLAGAILRKSQHLLSNAAAHPTAVADSLHKFSQKAVSILRSIAIPVDLSDRDTLIKSASTALNSKVVSNYSSLLSPLAVDAVLSILDPNNPSLVDLRDIKIVKKLGGTIDDTELIKGLVFDKKASHAAGGPTRVENAKIAVIQFQISPPKTDIEQSVVVSDYTQMDRILREERNYILSMVKKIKATGCNVLLIQKSILRDAVTDLSLHYLAKAKILVVKDIERDDIEFITKTLNCLPIANIEHFREDKLGFADAVEEVSVGESKVVRVTGIKNMGRTSTVVVRGSNQLVIDEAERSLHDALCVVRCLVNEKYLIAGGGAPEIELSRQLAAWAKELHGMESYCIKEFAEALEVIPYTLAENAGLNPVSIVTELRNRHARGETYAGINVRKGQITNILEENVVQPLLVSTSAITLATECVRMILKIDDIVMVR
ncbi:T-complex protein 1 subunit delta [Rhynchospora pubera]|uniref:T-complex protein 1 subunit delta n=1 Tax=Rhynchospora pubera TaxID=906938 RepID=A0AAV8DSZ3_9POAL|nr:T-complex protein 1 subunit delta [Rhynchospora pubera]KAJ4781709.1 T-complex protein 1 subunit delta [Rhynchospora pubera]KAJ4808144.1 T-complex protein 1 subunit delta [Rhynchospora pubera]